MAESKSDLEDEVKQLKLEGNGHFRQKNHKNAIEFYTKGIDHEIYSSTEKHSDALIELRQSLLLNRAKSHFQLRNLKDALIDSSNCIKTRDGSTLSYKAHYTRSEIYLHLKDYKNAIKHCDTILNAQASGMSALQQRTKKLKRQIKEASMSSTLTQHRGTRVNNIVHAMTLTMGEHRTRIESLQTKMNKESEEDIAVLVSCLWWKKWYALDAKKRLNEVDIGILMVNNSDLIISQETETKEDETTDTIHIESPYLKYHLREEMSNGEDYMILSFKSYQEMVKMGYKLEPAIWVKRIEAEGCKQYELHCSEFEVYYGDVVVRLLCSMNTSIRKLCTEIARHFVIQSSSIRLRRYGDDIEEILDGSHTLAQHEVQNHSRIYVEIRLPNGCWPIIKEIQSTKETVIASPNMMCHSCQRLITHYISCRRHDSCDASYCNNKHLAAHWKYHQASVSTDGLDGDRCRWGLCGLQNLGNTCYMNASLQCLSFIPQLRCYLTSDDYKEDINRDNALGFGGVLAMECAKFYKKMWFGLSDPVYPTAIRRTIGKLHSEWSSGEQQDAEEFIRWLLDGLHEDLNLVKKKPYYVLEDSGHRDESEVANEHWTLHLKRNQSIIVDIFQGQYKSTLQCPQSTCAHTSLKFDAFSALTLPIPDANTQIGVECLVFSSAHGTKPYKLTVNVSAKAVVTQLTANIMDKLGTKYLNCDDELSQQLLLVCRVNHCKFGKYWSSSRPIRKVLAHAATSPLVHVYQVASTTIAQRKGNDLIQVRMNFCYKHQVNVGRNMDSASDSSDEAAVSTTFNRLHFTHPIVTDMKCNTFTGTAMHKVFMEKYESICNEAAKIPDIHMFIRTESGEESYIDCSSDDVIPVEEWTNTQRNTATITVELSEYEYKLCIDGAAAVDALSLAHADDKKPKGFLDIYDCLKLFSAAEVLDDVVWKCSKCKKQGLQPSKQLHLWRLPQILIIHLKRFINQQGYFGGIGKKNSANVVAPINGLDLTQYCCSTSTVPKYDLFATLNHHGIMEFGHYYSCVRTDYTTQVTNYYQYHTHDEELEKPTWNLFNDEKVHPITVDTLKQYLKDAYLLFYRRRDTV